MVWNNFQSSPPPPKKRKRGKQEEEWGGHGCLVRSVKQWWTASDGKSIKKNPQNSKKIKSGVCRNGLETFVDPTVVDGHIYLLFIRKKEKKKRGPTERVCKSNKDTSVRVPSSVSPIGQHFLIFIPMADLVSWYGWIDTSFRTKTNVCLLAQVGKKGRSKKNEKLDKEGEGVDEHRLGENLTKNFLSFLYFLEHSTKKRNAP